MLLKAGADPNAEDSNGMTAFSYGIISGNSKVINLLAPVTTAGVNQIITKLAQARQEIEGELENYLSKIKDESTLNLCLEKASIFGNQQVLAYLLSRTDTIFSKEIMYVAFSNILKSDKAEAMEVFLEHFNVQENKENFSGEMVKLIIARGFSKLKKASRLYRKTNITTQRSEVLRKVPKSEEFDYAKLLKQISSLIQESYPSSSGKLLKYETLIKRLHSQVVHYDGKHLEENKCPDDCSQKSTCKRIRDVLYLLDQIVKKMSVAYPIFKNVISIVVGSIKEQTKIGKIDECDVLLVLDKRYKKFFEFDTRNQKVGIKRTHSQQDKRMEDLELPEELKMFVTNEEESDKYCGYFNTTKYFNLFILLFHKIIESGELKLPDGLHLNTKFTPCEVCKIDDYETPIYVRCRHDPGCEEHAKSRGNPKYKETCQCSNFTSPCLSWSKIGVVLHLEFVNDDGSVLNLDVDVSPPSFLHQEIVLSLCLMEATQQRELGLRK